MLLPSSADGECRSGWGRTDGLCKNLPEHLGLVL